MSTHRQLPPNTDIAPWQDKGRWYRIFGEKTADGVTISQSDIAGVTGAVDSDGNTSITIPGTVNGKNFHLVNAVSDVSSGTGTSGTGFTYPQIGVEYGDENSYNYVLNSKKTPEDVSSSMKTLQSSWNKMISNLRNLLGANVTILWIDIFTSDTTFYRAYTVSQGDNALRAIHSQITPSNNLLSEVGYLFDINYVAEDIAASSFRYISKKYSAVTDATVSITSQSYSGTNFNFVIYYV